MRYGFSAKPRRVRGGSYDSFDKLLPRVDQVAEGVQDWNQVVVKRYFHWAYRGDISNIDWVAVDRFGHGYFCLSSPLHGEKYDKRCIEGPESFHLSECS